MKHRIALAFFAALIAGTAACGGKIEIRLQPSHEMNRGPEGPNAVKVRIYRLKNNARFESATFQNLWVNGPRVLEGDLLGEVIHLDVVPPSSTEKSEDVAMEVKKDDETSFVGVAVLFSRPESSTDESPWKVVIPVEKRGSYTFQIHRAAIKVSAK